MLARRGLQSGTEVYDRKIKTVEELCHAIRDGCAFIALDMECAAIPSKMDPRKKHLTLYQADLAFLDTNSDALKRDEELSNSKELHIADFYTENNVRSLTLDVGLDNETQTRILDYQGRLPTRRADRFGEERSVSRKTLDHVMVDFIESCNPSKKKLILVGFGLAAEWGRLFTHCFRALACFSSWMDLRDIARGIAPTGIIQGQISLLLLCGYRWKDVKQGNHENTGIGNGTPVNVGNDAVSTLALMCSLLDPGIQEKLKARQECNEIAGPKNKYTHVSSIRHSFVTAAIESKSDSLPAMLSSEAKLARYFYNFSPRAVGFLSHSIAYMTFRSRQQLSVFIESANGLLLPTGETLLARPLEDLPMWKSMDEERNDKDTKIEEQEGQIVYENRLNGGYTADELAAASRWPGCLWSPAFYFARARDRARGGQHQ
ncbi:hypothetical protein N3K66_005262 [Trichothecium roseum]|uniref:Uncharacterized protein n=1 Tax=Trichothecium roseum TaxID=47278 RepID=A0ACC0V3N4_9HYPO|nr:hypothetical protein N3K66_005262 [Trichothecium roseum]